MMNATVNETVSMVINNKEYNITLSPNPENGSRAFIGILNVKNELEVKSNIKSVLGEKIPYSIIYLATLLNWLFILNVGIGVANLLPLRPLDGGFMINEIILSSRAGRRKKKIAKSFVKTIEVMVLMLFLINIFGPYVVR
jgi:membrane-associated protease RseP (regulator of RpoE activity)